MGEQQTDDVDGLPRSIRGRYDVTEEPKRWVLKCLGCDTGYQLLKPKPGGTVKPGNILALLDHAASHAKGRKWPWRTVPTSPGRCTSCTSRGRCGVAGTARHGIT